MRQFIGRRLSDHIITQKDKFPVLAVTGPRQSGKTTLLKSLFPNYRYISLESPNIRAFAQNDPVAFLAEYSGQVIFDEAQRAPHLFSYIQTMVDESGQMGQFILSGSQNFHLLKNSTQSLAGRVALFKLLPLDIQELHASRLLEEKYATAAVRGFYPALFHRNIDSTVFYSNYVQTYLEKDVSELIHIKDIQTFRTFLALCASRSGQLLNVSALANTCDIAYSTAKAWISILESSYIIFLLHPYHENFDKRIVKTAKLYFYDTGLLCHLLGISDPLQVLISQAKGPVFESMIVAEFQKANQHLYLHRQYYFWQDSNRNEVDLLRKSAERFHAFEIKATEPSGRITLKDWIDLLKWLLQFK